MQLSYRIQKLEELLRERDERKHIPEGMNGFYAALAQDSSLLDHLYPDDKNDNSR